MACDRVRRAERPLFVVMVKKFALGERDERPFRAGDLAGDAAAPRSMAAASDSRLSRAAGTPALTLSPAAVLSVGVRGSGITLAMPSSRSQPIAGAGPCLTRSSPPRRRGSGRWRPRALWHRNAQGPCRRTAAGCRPARRMVSGSSQSLGGLSGSNATSAPPPDMRRAEPGRAHEGDHPRRQRIAANRGQIVGCLPRRQRLAQIPGGVEPVAGDALPVQPVRLGRQLGHARADRNDPSTRHRARLRSAACGGSGTSCHLQRRSGRGRRPGPLGPAPDKMTARPWR